jgi:anthranilate synthase component 1
MQRIEQILLEIQQKVLERQASTHRQLEISCNVDDATFCEMVKKAKEYLYQGDAFQIVLSRFFYTQFQVPPIEIYRALKVKSPAPYMFFIQKKDHVIVGASPEKLVSLKNGLIEMMPIAGTRPIAFGAEGKLLEEDLINDEKENAEHMMLVDLGRNDIGKVSEPGTVEVKELKVLKRFSHVMHLVSLVQGKAKKGVTEVDVLKAVFPAGTLSGAPKVRAMEIIDELEHSRRGIYGGAICVLDGRGNLESCIAIRMAFLKDGRAVVRTGAGIVIDSDPEKEAEETRAKAKGILEAIVYAEAGNL